MFSIHKSIRKQSYRNFIIKYGCMQTRYNQNRIKLIFLLVFALPLLLLLSCGRDNSISDKKEITVVSYGGGAYQDSHKTAFCKPFADKHGVQVNSVVWNANYGKLKVMVESGRVLWDVVEVTAAQFARGQRDNLFEKLSTLPNEGQFIEGTVSDYGVANVYWGTVMAYRKRNFTNEQPATWTDFWDVKKFPGKRALYDDPRGNLEFALLADGVSKENLYPLDIDRAFRKLDEIKPYIRVWWTDGTQPVQLLTTGAADLSSAWNGRIYASKHANNEIGYSWNGAALELDYWIVPRGSKNNSIASNFVVFASQPKALAKQTELVGYGPVNTTALQYVSEDARIHLPTYKTNWDISFVVDAKWWSDKEEAVKTRWISWKAQ